MGITGLWKIVEPTATEIPLECLEGKKLAVDVSIWIYQAQLAYPSDQPFPHLRLLVNRLSKLLFYKIRPVFVFDGPQVPVLKRQVLEARRQKRQKDDDVLTNTKKMRQLREIAGGRLDEQQLAKIIQQVISPSKKVVLNDVYKDIPSTSVDLSKSAAGLADDLMNYEDEQSDSGDSDVVVVVQKEEEEGNKEYSKREQMQNLLDKREVMRNSRLHPEMIPTDSKSFSNFQMQRLLQRGRLNAQIDQLSKSSNSSSSTTADKINVTGPDGTRHVLQYAYSDEIQEIRQSAPKREIESLYRPSSSAVEMTLDLFNVEYGGKTFSRETTPDDVREEVVERVEERLVDKSERGYQSKSGMLEAIARKRIQLHYGTSLGEETEPREEHTEEIEGVSEDEMALQELLLESAAKNLDERMPDVEVEEEKEWDPQRYDTPTTSQQHQPEEYTHLNYADDDKTPELYRDLQEFLTNCGVPWIEAPGEAEAQCVELERLGLVDGVVSDDSDVWAFGVRHVYRHMFARNKRVQRFGETTPRNRENCTRFCLEREDYISIAMMAGGDYCQGLHKIGAIGALELISEFLEARKPGQNLEEVEDRIMCLLENVRRLFTTSPEQSRDVSRNAMTLRRHVNEANDRNVIEAVCSNRDAVHAYLHPTVDSSSEKFRWRPMNVSLVRSVLHQRLHWPDKSQLHEEKNSFDAFDKWNSFLTNGGQSQMRLDRFFAAQNLDEALALTWSKKALDAMERIRRRAEGEVVEIVEVEKKKKSPAQKRKPATRGRGRGGKVVKKTASKVLNLSEESSSDDSFDDV